MKKEYKGAILAKVRFYVESKYIDLFKRNFEREALFYIWRDSLNASSSKILDTPFSDDGIYLVGILESNLSKSFELNKMLQFGPLDRAYGYLKIVEFTEMSEK